MIFQVIPVNEFAPSLSSIAVAITVSEALSLNTEVLQLTATDQDSTDTSDGQITYSMGTVTPRM